jgi:hypothetical protein
MAKSILPPEFRGVTFITGRRGVGKSFLAAQADIPDNVVYFDFEAKAEGLHNQLHFGAYYPVTEMAVGRGVAGTWDVMLDLISKLPLNRYTVAVIDNVSPLELAMKAEATRNAKLYAKEFSLQEGNITAGRYGGASSVVNFLVTDKICAPLHAKGIQLIVVTAHVKPPWANGVPISNKWNSLGATRWQELSILSLVLVAGEHAPVPAALVQKEQLGSITFDAEQGEFVIQRRLPLRIPRCTFAEVKRYIREPANLANPAVGEKPSDDEYYQFSEELSKEQLSIMRMALEVEKRSADEEAARSNNGGPLIGSLEAFEVPPASPPVEMTPELNKRILTLKAEGKSAQEIKKLLSDDKLEVPLPMIIKAKEG